MNQWIMPVRDLPRSASWAEHPAARQDTVGAAAAAAAKERGARIGLLY